MKTYDLIVLGVGSAGSRAAATAHQAGKSVLAIDAGERLGGLCILRGCMPTKTLLETAHRLHEIRTAAPFGIHASEPSLDFRAMMDRMRSLVERFRNAKVGSIEGAGYELRRGSPRFVDPHHIELDGEKIEGKTFVLCTGSKVRPIPVPVEEGAEVRTSDDLFELQEVPGRVVVLGAGAVGLEFAQWLARIGTRVLLGNRSPLLRRKDPEMGEELRDALGEEMEVLAPARIEEILKGEEGGARVRFELHDGSERVVDCDFVLDALGRIPNFDGLELEAAGLSLKGERLACNSYLQTEVPHIFVAGDTTGSRLILHEANLEGQRAARNAMRLIEGEHSLEGPDPRVPPFDVIFTDPPFASVGRNWIDLDREGVPYREATKFFPKQGRGICMGVRHGFMRLLAAPDTGKVLGCQILGPRGDDLIHVPMAVLAMGGTVHEMLRFPWYHPTLSESFIEVARELSNQCGREHA
ncbi:MAG TPA: dihydrolipoyl dehydrogenase [Planctomycetes bacterium]|nr:dihydrolipoyl dehydrogenase [Planctomycetota bacterium]